MNLVRYVMATDVKAAAPETPVEEVARMMAEGDVGSIPVVSNGTLEGIVTDRDIAIRVVAEGRDPAATTASDVMSTDPVTVSPDNKLTEARELMAQHQVRRLPVVKGAAELVGMLSLGDVAVQDPSERATGETLQEISRSVDTETTNEGEGPEKGTPERVRQNQEATS